MARAAIQRSAIGGVLTTLAALAMLPAFASAGAPSADIVDYFRVYYQTQVANAPEFAALDFLRSAAANHVAVTEVLKPGATRAVVVDRRNGYLRISDSSGTDQDLTMAFYTKAGGRRLVVVGGSDCADGCDFLVQLFIPDGGGLKPVPRQLVMPAVGPSDFIMAGHPIPKALVGLKPKINYVPARVGTALTLKPWYGYEVEEGMDAATRGAIQDVELKWERATGVFIKSGVRSSPR